MKAPARPTGTARAGAPAAAVLPAAVLAFLTAPAGWIVIGFRAGEGSSIPGLAWIAASVGAVLVAGVLLATRSRGDRNGKPSGAIRAARGLAVAAALLAAAGPVFWLLVQLAPPEGDALDGALIGPAGFLVAILVGMISFFSPCILPLIPGYLSFVSGLSGESVDQGMDRRRVVIGTVLFTAGFATVFTILGATASLIGSFFVDHFSVVNRVAGAIVIVMGIAYLAPQMIRVLEAERRPLMGRVRPGLGGAFPLGLAFAVGWTPCVGPGLGAMLGLAGGVQGSGARVAQGALLLFFFSVGFGIWFVLAALGIRRTMAASSWLRRNARAVQAVGGLFLVALGVLLVTDLWVQLLGPLQRLINQFAPPV